MGCVFYMQSTVVEMAPAHCLSHSFLFLLSEVLKRRFIRHTYSPSIPEGRSFKKYFMETFTFNINLVFEGFPPLY